MTRILDLTRLVSRVGRVQTGIDRVERAYLDRFLSEPGEVWFLVRTAYGFVLLDRRGGAAFQAAMGSGDWGRADLLSRLRRRLTAGQRLGQSFARRHSSHRCRSANLSSMLTRANLAGADYFNMGHANLTPVVFAAMRQARIGTISAMLHDAIPLDYPELQRPEVVARFDRIVRAVAQNADRVLTVSAASAAALTTHLEAAGRKPEIVVAHLGVNVAPPQHNAIPPGLDLTSPFFVAIGTIEPRKNHALLLHIWGSNRPDWPRLLICGARGWLSDDLFAKLDAGVPGVEEWNDLTDGALSAILRASNGLLMPSLAEGFGLPPVEAASLGVPVICSDLPVFREVLGNYAVYHDPTDIYSWANSIKEFSAQKRAVADFSAPTWDDHFRKVLG